MFSSHTFPISLTRLISWVGEDAHVFITSVIECSTFITGIRRLNDFRAFSIAYKKKVSYKD